MITSYEFLATWLRARFDDEKGASLVEYALLVALIAVVCIAAVTLLGKNASSKFDSVGQSIARTSRPKQRDSWLGAGDRARPQLSSGPNRRP